MIKAADLRRAVGGFFVVLNKVTSDIFNVRRLVILLTAKEVVKVIYFPTIAERALAYQLVFEV